jgi:tRNA 2-selenouridine synthase
MAFILRKLPADAFLGQRKTTPVADVRSPGEYAEGHIPGAVNIPLFDDEQRAEVGTVYKKEGNINAVLRGIDLAAPGMSDKLRKALDLASGGKLLVHCWRGGMRSEAMAWLFSQGGIDSSLLEGGYKAYRNHILSDLGRERKFFILGGLTGSGKTGILRHMKSAGVQVTDLEGLASHRGSAFGALGQAPQPTSEHFANLLYDDLASMRDDEPVWLEDESRNIGTVFMPDCFSLRMQTAPVIALMMSIETRLPRLLEEYTTFPAEEIMASVMKISKRLGGDRTREAADALRKGDYPTAIRITLEYYDKAYHYGLSKRPEGQVTYINTETDDVGVNAALVMEAARNLG